MNMSDYDGRTALHLSCAEGHLEAAKFLLEICKVHPEPTDRSGLREGAVNLGMATI